MSHLLTADFPARLTPPAPFTRSRLRQSAPSSLSVSVGFCSYKIKPDPGGRPLSSQHRSTAAADAWFPLTPRAAISQAAGMDGGDAAEWKKVAQLRAVVQARDPASKEDDDFKLRRFLRAQDQNIAKASAMILKYLAWKRTAKPRGTIADDEVRNELLQEKIYMQGHDKMDRPMVYLLAARHIPSRRGLDELKRYVTYVLDKTCARLPAGQEKFGLVVDLKGWGYANCDVKACLAGLHIIRNYYPEQLERVFLVHAPYVFMGAWKMGSVFVDDNTKKKFAFVSDRDLRDAIDESQLPDLYGGKLKLQADYPLQN